jgi:hypothetical protein
VAFVAACDVDLSVNGDADSAPSGYLAQNCPSTRKDY